MTALGHQRSVRSQAGAQRHVLHVITPSRMAGAETFLARLLQRVSAGATVHHCVASRNAAGAEMRAARVEFEALSINGKANLLALLRLSRAVRRYRADLLHSHLSTASWWCGWLEQLGGPPSIGHVHGLTSATWHRRQTHLIACSQAVRKSLVENGISPEQITVLYYAIDPGDVRPARSPAAVRAEFGVAADTPVVGTFAHLSLKKGYRELVQAAERVLRQIPTAQFWCFGEGPLRQELTTTIQALGIADRFRLFGFRRDVPDLMHAVDLMCLPSHCEPFGIVYVEAALSGKPVIACDAGGAPEVVIRGETGLLVPPPKEMQEPQSVIEPASNVAAIAEAILTLLHNRDRAASMGQLGRELALERFGWPRYLARLNKLYDDVLDQNRTHARRAA